MPKRIFLSSSLILLFAICAHSQVNLNVSIDSVTFRIGEQTNVQVNVTLDAHQKVIFPEWKSGTELIPNVEILAVTSPDTTMLNDGKRMEFSRSYTITAWDSALYVLPPYEVMVDGKKYTAPDQLAIKVLTVDVDTLHVDQFFPPYGPMRPDFLWAEWVPVITVFLLIILFAVAAFMLISWAKKGKPLLKVTRKKPKLLPHTQAILEIERIKASHLWTAENSKEYYTLLTDTLRTYIMDRYGFNAREMTSREIVERLTSENNDTGLSELRQILATADLVKFAKYETLMNENDANLMAALEYVNQTKKEEIVQEETVEPVTPTEKKQSRQVKLMYIAGGVLILLAFISQGWLIWRLYDLLYV